MVAFTKQYKGICGNCAEYRHDSRNCPQNKPNGFKFQIGKSKSGAACYHCGEKGHYMRDCPVKKKANMIKMSKAKEFGNIMADEEQCEPKDDESIKEVNF